MEERIPELERFGKGFKWIETKAEALDDYEFHVAIENHFAPHVWTEKLADAFLGFTVPIYFGCPNVYDYFPKENIIFIESNELKNNFAATLKRLFNFLEVPFEDVPLKESNKSRVESLDLEDEKKVLAAFYQPYNEKLYQLINKRYNW